MIFTYNKEHIGDVLMIIVKNSGDAKLDVERKGKVARVFLKDNGETVAWNIFEVSSLFEIAERGQVFLTDEQVTRLNQELQAEDFTEKIVNDKEPKFVVGEIVEMVAHPDSDHLNICQVAVASDKTVQIVAARKKVEAKAAALEKDAARLSKADIQKRQDEINKLAASEDASLQKLMQEQDKKVAEFQAQNEKRQAEERGKLLDSIQTATNNYAKANGYSYVLDANSVVFAVEGKDISDAVLKTIPATQKTEEKK